MKYLADNKEKICLILIGLLILGNFILWQEVFDFAKQNLEVIFFEVGQGDAIFIETPEKHQILIDGGPDSTILEKLAKELPFWDRRIDLIILTHPERDHLVGLIEVLKSYKIDYILWTGVVRQSLEYDKWKELIEKEKAELLIAQNNQRIRVGKAFIDILYPLKSLEGKKFKNSNDSSIVSRLVFGENSFLFTGDISRKIERKLIEEKINLMANVLKVGHHGSKYSSTDKFLATIKPEIAIIQVGKNNYGHPASEVLERLRKFLIEVLRTDKDGDIKIITDGKNLMIK